MKNKLILIFTLILILLPISMSVKAAAFTVPIQYIETDSSDVSAWGFLNSLNGIMQFMSPLYFDSTAGGLQIVIYADSTGKIDTNYVAFQQYVADHAGAGAGESNTSSSAGSGFLLTLPKSVVDLPFKTLIGGDAITLDSTVANEINIAFDGGATPGGALGGTWASPTVDDDGHNHTDATVADAITVNPVNTTTETAIEAVVDLQDLQGAVTDGQVPSSITIDFATQSDTTRAIDTNYVPFQTYVADHAGGAGEANTLNDSGSFNNTEGFGLAGVKQGVALFLKGLVEGTNITITPLGDTAYSIAAAGGGGAGVWADTVGVLNAVWFIDSQNDTFLVIQDSIPGQVVIQAGQGQSLSIVADSATFGLINVNGSASGTIGLLSTTGGMVAHTVYDTLSDTTEFVWGQDGSAGQQVTTDGSGNFYFADAGSGVGYWDSTIVDNDSIVYQIVNVGAQGNDTLIEFIHDTSATDITYIQRTVGGRIDLKDIGEIYFDQITNGAWVEGKQWYDPEENAMTYYNNNSQMTIQLAQEMIKEVRNVSGDSIPDGTPVYQVDGGVTGHKPHVAAADADDSAKGLVFGVTTTAIGNNSDGYVAIGGAIHGLNTSAYTVGDELYLDTVAGGLTTSLYDINTGGVYRAYIGQVVVSHASTGVISINVARMPAAYEIPRLDSVVAVQIEDSLNTYTDTTSNRVYFDSAMQHLDGMAYDKPAIVIAEYQTDSGLVVEVEKLGGGDMVFRLDGVNSTLDCTTGDAPGGQASVNINDGTDKYNPAGTWLYVTNSGGVATLESSGTRPIGSFCWVGYIFVADTATFNDVGPYAFQRTTEAFTNNGRGTESQSREKLRALGATYISGLVPTLTIYSTPDPDTLHLDITAGKVYQLNSQDFPAWDDGPYYYGNGDSIYAQVGDLSEALVEQDGTSLSGTRYVLVFWGAINYSTGVCKVYVNLPSGSYTKDDPAISDAELTADYSIPEGLRGQAFMIAKVVLRHTTTAGGTWTSLGDGVYDLRGVPVGVRTGGTTAGPASTEFSDVDFKIYDNVDATKEIMFEASGITAATTRTYTFQDKDGTLAHLADFGPFIDTTTVDTILNAHKAVESDSTDAITDGGVDLADLANDALAAMGDSARAAAADTATGIRNGSIWTGVHDAGGATSLEIPNADNTNPTVEGQVFHDTNDDALIGTDGTIDYVYAGKFKSFQLELPASYNDTSSMIYIDSTRFPHGIKITEIRIHPADSVAFSTSFAETTDSTRLAWIDTVANVTASWHTKSNTFTDADIAPGHYIEIAGPDVAHTCQITILYYIKEGD